MVLATGARLEGQTTSHYLASAWRNSVRLTQLAHGLPVGGGSIILMKARWPKH